MSTFPIDIHAKTSLYASTYLGMAPMKAGSKAAAAKPAAGAKPAATAAAAAAAAAAAPASGANEDKLYLDEAEMGKVQTRFPPEASGFLHIGHAKALLVNRMLADKYQGKMLFRFDDTNPAKEKVEFEQAILHDMGLLGVTADIGPTHSSDYFDKFQELAEVLIKQGDAYCDKTGVDEMRQQRFDGIANAFRETPVAENMHVWKEMLAGSAEGQSACLRFKMDIVNPNKALRDPVIYRVNLTPHARTGSKYKAYPTYDFCCPIIDSLEGVSHALRTSEYHDRNAQYFWILDALKMRKPHIQDFSRLNMEYALMSKRKLTKMVEDGVVDGWDDPRFPTVRGLLRRGMCVGALREFVKVQGMSKAVNLMEWSKIWNFNNQEIDMIAPRYTACDADRQCVCTVTNYEGGAGGAPKMVTRLRHKKNPDLGEKQFAQAPTILLDSEDVLLLKEGDEVTLMDWGNAFVKNMKRNDAGTVVVSADVELNPAGDVKKTKYKLTWVGVVPQKNVKVLVKEFEHLLNKKKPEEGDDIDAITNKHTLFKANLVGEPALAEVKKGQYMQLERRGFYICDSVDDKTGLITLHAIPDGRDKINHLSAKAAFIKANPTLAASLPGAAAPAAAGGGAKPAAKKGGGGDAGAADKMTLEQKRAEKAAKKAAAANKGAAPAS